MMKAKVKVRMWMREGMTKMRIVRMRPVRMRIVRIREIAVKVRERVGMVILRMMKLPPRDRAITMGDTIFVETGQNPSQLTLIMKTIPRSLETCIQN
jgi:hypothetical protein